VIIFVRDVGVTNFKGTVAAVLTYDVEYRVYEIIQPLYSFYLNDNLKFQHITTNQFYVEDDEWEFENVFSSAIPRVSTDVKNLINWIKD
ncbi:14105_t:CDS:2, partial [Funneliformis geosporum]